MKFSEFLDQAAETFVACEALPRTAEDVKIARIEAITNVVTFGMLMCLAAYVFHKATEPVEVNTSVYRETEKEPDTPTTALS